MKEKKQKKILLSIIMLVLALMLIGCQAPVEAGVDEDVTSSESGDFVKGTIGGTEYNKSGVSFVSASDTTIIMCADTTADLSSYTNVWQIYFSGNTIGTFTGAPNYVGYYITSPPNGEIYLTMNDFSLTITEYSTDRISGTFSGTIDYYPAGPPASTGSEILTGSFSVPRL